MKEVPLASGAVLKIGEIPFDPCNELRKAVMEAVLGIPMPSEKQFLELAKDLLCSTLTNKKIEACLWECLKRCLYCDGRGDLKIDKQTFEPLSARGDYIDVQLAVAEEALLPFGKSLYAALQRLLSLVGETPRT